MDAILLCMKKRGIRFFGNIKFPTVDVLRFHEKNNFLRQLRSRYNEYDNILVMAHGANHAILTTTTDLHKHYAVYIGKEDTVAFKNDFVFAVSCLTANEFGQSCINNGSIAYLGYQCEIGCLFSCKPHAKANVPGAVITAIDTLIKHIFVEELSKAYEDFLMSPISVQVLKERFAFGYERRLAELLDMSAAEIHHRYNIKITERHHSIYMAKIVLDVLSNLNEIMSKLVCVGDENYISSSYLKFRKQAGYTASAILAELESNSYFLHLKHEKYKDYLRKLAVG